MVLEWYFVRRLREHERRGEPERFEIQLLDDDGRAIGVGYVGATTSSVNIAGYDVPPAVIDAARERESGDGEYVGPDGKKVAPF